MQIRRFRPDDLEILCRMTVQAFDGIAIDQNVENALGIVGGHDWRWRKSQHIKEDVDANAEGVLVAEIDGKPVGFISTRLDHAAKKGRIANLAVDSLARGQGIGRALIEQALIYLRGEGMEFVMIETMTNNPVGQHLYPSCGFIEAGHQIHYVRR